MVCVCVRVILHDFGFRGSLARDSFCIAEWEHSNRYIYFSFRLTNGTSHNHIVVLYDDEIFIYSIKYSPHWGWRVWAKAGGPHVFSSSPVTFTISLEISRCSHIAHATHLHCVYDEECCRFSKGSTQILIKWEHLHRSSNKGTLPARTFGSHFCSESAPSMETKVSVFFIFIGFQLE